MIKKIIIEHEGAFIGYASENGVAVTVGIMPTEAPGVLVNQATRM